MARTSRRPYKTSEAENGADNGKTKARYVRIIETIFRQYWKNGKTEFVFERDELAQVCKGLGIAQPKNLGDIIYTFRYRRPLPKFILDTQPANRGWLILGDGDARYRFRLNKLTHIRPTNGLLVRKIPDATPEIISHYALNDEQALLAKVRYNRLIDVFLGITAYSLQNHLRTKIENYGQIEIDELYVGVDSSGAQYIVPVQAKGGGDILGAIQTIQDVTFCKTQERYRDCIPRAVSAQFLTDDTIALFETTFDGDEVSIVRERHYKLTESKEIASADLQQYRTSRRN
ncbi:MAG TPA: endonuclease [Patescibacteria group bacterium]|nr:endonuclease [Patescibacteria group bacterium]